MLLLEKHFSSYLIYVQGPNEVNLILRHNSSLSITSFISSYLYIESIYRSFTFTAVSSTHSGHLILYNPAQSGQPPL